MERAVIPDHVVAVGAAAAGSVLVVAQARVGAGVVHVDAFWQSETAIQTCAI